MRTQVLIKIAFWLSGYARGVVFVTLNENLSVATWGQARRGGNDEASEGVRRALVQREWSKARHAGLETSCIERSIYK